MATREENLKKINDELELLSDEQLDEIAGGVRRMAYMASAGGVAMAGGLAMAGGVAMAGGNAELANDQIVRMASENHTKII